MSEHYEEVTRRVKIITAPCIKCGSDDIVLYHCNYSSFNKGGGECKGCKASSSGDVGCFPTKRELAKIWNNQNDPMVLIAALDNKITVLTLERARIEQIVRDRKKEPLAAKNAA